MTQLTTYRMPFRRRREAKTDYRKRLHALKSDLPRLLVRKSNCHMRVQVTKYKAEGDETVLSAHSQQLKEFGWKQFGNIPAAYATGYLCGKAAVKAGVKAAILDIGLQTPVHGTRVFAALKGAVDAGLKVKAGEGIYPSEERLHGKHIEGFDASLVDKTLKAVDAKTGGK